MNSHLGAPDSCPLALLLNPTSAPPTKDSHLLRFHELAQECPHGTSLISSKCLSGPLTKENPSCLLTGLILHFILISQDTHLVLFALLLPHANLLCNFIIFFHMTCLCSLENVTRAVAASPFEVGFSALLAICVILREPACIPSLDPVKLASLCPWLLTSFQCTAFLWPCKVCGVLSQALSVFYE